MSIARHTLYNATGALLPLIVSVVTVPIYLTVVGLDRYGILNLCWLLVGYFGFFDFGLGRATTQRIAALHDSDPVARSRSFWTALTLSAGLAALATIIAVPLSWVALGALKIEGAGLRAEIHNTLPLLVAAVPLAIFQSVLRGALEGREQFLVVNVVFGVGAIATAILPLAAAAVWGPDLPILVAVSLLVRSFVLIAFAAAAVRTVPITKYLNADRQDMRKMVRFGGWLTITNIVSPIMTFVDRFLLGAILGAAAIALYAIPFNLVSQLVIAPGALATAMFPRFAGVDCETGRALSRRKLEFLSFVVTPLSIIGICVAEPFLRLWIGSASAAVSTPVALVLVVGFWANSLALLPYARLQAAERTDIMAKIHLAELLPYVIVLWLCMKYLGIVGAAVAWSLRCMADALALALSDRVGRGVLLSIGFRGALVIGTVAAFLISSSSFEHFVVIAAVAVVLTWHMQQRIPSEVRTMVQVLLTRSARVR